MSNTSDDVERRSNAADPIDPDIRRFATRVNADYARLTGGRQLTVPRCARSPRRCARRGAPAARPCAARSSTSPRLRPVRCGCASTIPVVRAARAGARLPARRRLDALQPRYARPRDARIRGAGRRDRGRCGLCAVTRGTIPGGARAGRRGRALAARARRRRSASTRPASRSAATPPAATCPSARRSRCATRGKPTRPGLLLIYPAFDKYCSPESLRRYGGPGAVLTAEEVEYFWDNYTGDASVLDEPARLPDPRRARRPAADRA